MKTTLNNTLERFLDVILQLGKIEKEFTIYFIYLYRIKYLVRELVDEECDLRWNTNNRFVFVDFAGHEIPEL